MFKPIILVPFYNHFNGFERIADKLCGYSVPVLLVNDGSNVLETDKVKGLCHRLNIAYIGYKTNGGKGYAVKKGFKYAEENGYTHVLQFDADGQHCDADIPLFLSLAKKNPESLINGCPVYDNSVPKSRLYGRKITDFWVYVETGGAKIADSMCGFRVYPLAQTKDIMQNVFCDRMGFDIEIIVKCVWQKINVINQPTKVSYPADGVSHFKMFKDNFCISMMHSRLCVMALFYLVRSLFGGNKY